MPASRKSIIVSDKHRTSYGNDMITVQVGEGAIARTFTIPKTIITKRSLFFANALKSTWQESISNTITLPTEDPDLFNLYLSLIFHNHLPLRPDPAPEDKNAAIFVTLCELYLLCDRLRDPAAQNTLILALFEATNLPAGGNTDTLAPIHLPTAEAINIIYDGTPGPCAIRALLVDLWTFNVREKKRDVLFGERFVEGRISEEFLWDLGRNLVSFGGASNRRWGSGVEIGKYFVEEEEEEEEGEGEV